MEALVAAYDSSSSESHEAPPAVKRHRPDISISSAPHALPAPLLPTLPRPNLPLPDPPPLDPLLPGSSLPLPDLIVGPTPSPVCVRQFEHVDGAFATHVYLPIQPGPSLQRAIDRCISQLSSKALELHAIDPANYHLSLSKTVTLRQPQLQAFTDALRLALRRCHTVFNVPVTGPHALANDTDTRFFAAVELKPHTAGHGAVCDMVDAVDRVMTQFGFPPFYRERRMHFSVAWSLTKLSALNQSELDGCKVSCDKAACRIGSRVTDFKLAGSLST